MQNTTCHKRNVTERSEGGGEFENCKASVEKHNLSHADTQLRSHARTKRSRFPVKGDGPKDDAQPPNSDQKVWGNNEKTKKIKPVKPPKPPRNKPPKPPRSSERKLSTRGSDSIKRSGVKCGKHSTTNENRWKSTKIEPGKPSKPPPNAYIYVYIYIPKY